MVLENADGSLATRGARTEKGAARQASGPRSAGKRASKR
jgi:hypothetical protein